MSRRSNGAAEAAAAAASEAARTLQARGAEVRQERETLHLPKEEPEKEFTNPEVAKVPRGNVVRQAVLEDIRKSRGEGEPQAEQQEDPPKDTPAEPEVKQEAKPEEKPVEAQPAEAAVVAPEVQPQMVKVKVDGEEFEVPQTEIDEAGGIVAYRTSRAAQNRLKEAKEAIAEAKRERAELLSLLQQARQPVEAPKPQVTDAQFIQEKLDVIRFGSPEEGAAALQEIMGRNRVDPNAVTQQALAQMEHMLAVREFDKEFSDVFSLPFGPELVMALRAKGIQQAHQTRQPIDWGNFYRTIGVQVRNALGGQRQSQPTTPTAAAATTVASPTGNPSQVSEKEAKKASIVNLPTAAARAVQSEEPKPETREESLNRMRARRGLPTV